MFLFVCSLEFEIPPDTQKGEISTIEGFLMTAAKNLGMFQEERLQQNPEVGEKVREISRFMKMYMFLTQHGTIPDCV
jgi:C4-type Zn-finger protein